MTRFVDVPAAEAWIREAVCVTGPIELERDRAWASVYRVPTRDGFAWFKACRPIQAFEPRLTAVLAERWPDRVVRVLAHDEPRAWLLTADARDEVGKLGNAPEIWLRALPLYAELQRGEVEHVQDHLAHGVPDRRAGTLAAGFAELVRSELPLEPDEIRRLRAFEPRLAELCRELERASPLASIQHDDLHLRSLYVDGPNLRVLDWGDASVGHPFASLVVTFRFLESVNGLRPDDPWLARLRDAYLEPWGAAHAGAFDLAFRAGMVGQVVAGGRHRAAMSAEYRQAFDVHFADTLRQVLARAVRSGS